MLKGPEGQEARTRGQNEKQTEHVVNIHLTPASSGSPRCKPPLHTAAITLNWTNSKAVNKHASISAKPSDQLQVASGRLLPAFLQQVFRYSRKLQTRFSRQDSSSEIPRSGVPSETCAAPNGACCHVNYASSTLLPVPSWFGMRYRA